MNRLQPPAVILAADHRARGVLTVENYARYLDALTKALPHCDGILASAQPMGDLKASGALEASHRTYLSLNRTGLAGSSFELDDRLVATVGRAAAEGWTGVKHMVRIDMGDPVTAAALELLGRILEEAAAAGLEALVEAAMWRYGAMGRHPDDVVKAAVIAHDMGAPVLKVPIPDVTAGPPRVEAVTRVVQSVGVPVLFLGGPWRDGREEELWAEVLDVMAGGAAGLAIGRAVYQSPSPATVARELASIVHRSPLGGG